MQTTRANRHPAGLLRFQLDLGGAEEDEVAAVQAAMGDAWVLETHTITDGRVALLITERDEEKLAAWAARRAEAVERERGLRDRFGRLLQLHQEQAQELAAVREELRAYLQGREVAP